MADSPEPCPPPTGGREAWVSCANGVSAPPALLLAAGGSSRGVRRRSSARQKDEAEQVVSPRAWMKSPSKASVPHTLSIAVVAQASSNEGESASSLPDAEPAKDGRVVLPVHLPGDSEKTAAPLLLGVDLWAVPTDDTPAVSSWLDAFLYHAADRAADGFHVAVLGVDALNGISGCIDTLFASSADGASASSFEVTALYLLDLFENDSVNIDVTAVAIAPHHAAVYDLLDPTLWAAVDEGAEVGSWPRARHVQHNAKWGITGTLRTAALNGMEDVPQLPAAQALSSLSLVDDGLVVAYQIRIRRTQSVRYSDSVGGDFDVVQHVLFVALPNRGTLSLPSSLRRRARSGSHVGLVDAITHGLLPSTNGASSCSGAASGTDGGASNGAGDDDDSAAFMCQSLLRGLLRHALVGETVATAVLRTATESPLTGVSACALQQLVALRDATARSVRPVVAPEVSALMAAHLKAEVAVEALQNAVSRGDFGTSGPVILVDRSSFTVVALSPEAQDIVGLETTRPTASTVALELMLPGTVLGETLPPKAAEKILIEYSPAPPRSVDEQLLHVRVRVQGAEDAGSPVPVAKGASLSEGFLMVVLFVNPVRVGVEYPPGPTQRRAASGGRVEGIQHLRKNPALASHLSNADDDDVEVAKRRAECGGCVVS